MFSDFWLSQLAYRVNATTGVVSFGVGIMLLLGMLMVVSQTVKAASTNPVDCLMGE